MKWLILLAVAALGAGCASSSTPPVVLPIESDSTVTTTSVEPTTPPIEKESHPVSFPAMFKKDLNGSDFTVGRILARENTYTRYYITYKSGDLTISGIMNVPNGTGPFPVLILNHGHIDTSIYTNGRGLRREQDYLARKGFVVVHPDYRNHAESSKDKRDELVVRLSYVEDVLNAILALKEAKLPYTDTERVGMLGHSMGGGVTLGALTVRPDLIDAAVLYAPVSGNMQDSYERWMSRRHEVVKEINALYGSPSSTPGFWNDISSENFYDRITAPISIFHGTSDDSVPLEWSERTRDLLLAKQKNVTLTIYPNAPHEFATDWPAFMRSAELFFLTNLRK